MIKADGKIYLTPKGQRKLEEELEHLKTTGREEIADFMAKVLAEGDISENSGYDDARAKMGALESRIFELEIILAKAIIVDESQLQNNDTVNIGATIDLENETGKKFTFTIVGTHEVDAMKGLISDESPIGQAVLGRKNGESIQVPTPKGKTIYTIVSIRYEN